jgi:hypothetical protein
MFSLYACKNNPKHFSVHLLVPSVVKEPGESSRSERTQTRLRAFALGISSTLLINAPLSTHYPQHSTPLSLHTQLSPHPSTMFRTNSIFDTPSPSPPRGSSPSLSLFGSPQPQSANAYEAAEARTFFISPEDRVVYVPPRTTQTQPSTTSHTMSGPPPLPGAVASAIPTFDPRTASTPGPEAHLRQAPASSFAPSFGFGASVPSSAGQTETPEQLRNRLLGGPSTLTLMRREREVKAKRADEAGTSTGAVSGGAATSTGLFGGGAVPHSGDTSGFGFFSSLRSQPHASASRPSEGTSAGDGLFGGGECHTSRQHEEGLSEAYLQLSRAC